MKFSIIVPVYNGEHTVELLAEKINLFFSKTTNTHELIFVHDCGKDNSAQVLSKLSLNSDKIKVIYLNRNFGQHNAIICGFNYCSGDFIITMDEDLQHDPEDIELLIKEQPESKADVVYGTSEVLGHSFFRNFTSKIIKNFLAIAIPELHKDYSAFRMIKISIAKEVIQMRNSYTFLDGYLTWITQNVSSVKVSHNKRVAGESSYNVKMLINHLLNIVFTFSKLPVKLLTYISLIFLFLSIVYSSYIIIRKIFFNDLLQGFSTMIILLGIGIGLILLGLSILGEYLYRVNLKTTKRPNFIEKK